MMLTYRLLRLIETHSDQLARELLSRVQSSERTKTFNRVPAAELESRLHEIYRNLGDWLLKKTEFDIERRYCEIGARRAHQHVPLHELLWAIIEVKEYLWEFLKKEGMIDRPVELLSELEMIELTDHFFNRAMYYAAVGYEKACAGEGKTRTVLNRRRSERRLNVVS